MNRHPSGTSIGGQWAPGASGEVDADFDFDDPSANPFSEDARRSRVNDLFESRGMVDAKTLKRGFTGDRDSAPEWWGNTDAAGAYHAGNRVPKMERDAGGIVEDASAYSKKSSSSYRKSYETSDGHSVKIPSKASILRYSNSVTPGAPFDVPFEYQDNKGKTNSGWMRMRRSADGTVTADVLGEEGHGRRAWSTRAAEITSATLEGRRAAPSNKDGSTASAKDLQAKYEERKAADLDKVKFTPLKSSFIKGAEYSEKNKSLVVAMNNGRVYEYKVPKSTFKALANSTSPGKAYNKLVKPAATSRQLDQCPMCKKLSADIAKHSCQGGVDAGTAKNNARIDATRLSMSGPVAMDSVPRRY